MDLNYQLSWHQLAHRLIDDLVRYPKTTLPGIQAIGKQYKVTRLTVERALQHLEDLKVIAPVEPRKRRQINLPILRRVASQQDRFDNRIFFISDSPSSHLPFMARDIYEAFHVLCEQEHLVLNYVEIPTNITELRTLLISLQPRAIILYTAPVAVAEIVFLLNIPAIGIGTPSLHIPTFNTSYNDLLVSAFQQAVKAGHRSITLPVWKTSRTIYEELAEWLEKYFPSSLSSFNKRYHLPFIKSGSKADYHATLHELFRYTPPTCIILHGISQYLTTSSFLLKEGLRIPDDVSIIFLSQDPLLEDIVPSVAHFSLYSDTMINDAFHILQEQITGLKSQQQTELIPIWIPGDSLASLNS
jgi:DNA-binding LacI/PurR family transcriptional regulator